MRIEFDFDLGPNDREPLREALGCSDHEIEARLKLHAKAALHEYVEAYLGRRAFNRGTEILEHRLALLIEHAFDGALPDEEVVSHLFQTTPTTSRSLLRSTQSKYRYQLRESAGKTAKPLLEKAPWDGGQNAYQLGDLSSGMLQLLTKALSAAHPTAKPIERVTDTVAAYEASLETHKKLCAIFGATPKART